MSTYGPGSRFGVLHDDYGTVPAAEDLKPGKSSNHGQAISFEFILETNPAIFSPWSNAHRCGCGCALMSLRPRVRHPRRSWHRSQRQYSQQPWQPFKYLALNRLRAALEPSHSCHTADICLLCLPATPSLKGVHHARYDYVTGLARPYDQANVAGRWHQPEILRAPSQKGCGDHDR